MALRHASPVRPRQDCPGHGRRLDRPAPHADGRPRAGRGAEARCDRAPTRRRSDSSAKPPRASRGPKPAAAAQRRRSRPRLAARLPDAGRHAVRGLPAAGGRVAEPEAHDRVRRRRRSNRRARRSPRSARSRSRPTPRSRSSERLVSFSDMALTETELPVPHQGADAGHRRRDRQGHSRRGARHRPRPCAGHRRQEPDPAEERRRREGRPADDLLQPDAGRARQHRRRADLEPHQGKRPEVRRQHELGPVPARTDQDVLPAAQRRRGSRRPT